MMHKQTELVAALERVGVCTTCLQPFVHHCDEPFASCLCGTAEWYDTNYTVIKLQIENYNLKQELNQLKAIK